MQPAPLQLNGAPDDGGMSVERLTSAMGRGVQLGSLPVAKVAAPGINTHPSKHDLVSGAGVVPMGVPVATGAGTSQEVGTVAASFVPCDVAAAAARDGASVQDHRVVDAESGTVLLQLSNGVCVSYHQAGAEGGQCTMQVR